MNAKNLHNSSLVVDLHTDALYEHVKGAKDITRRTDVGHLDIPRMREGGINAEVFAVWTNPEKLAAGERAPFVHKAIDAFEEICHRCPDDIALARTPDELLAITGSTLTLPSPCQGEGTRGTRPYRDFDTARTRDITPLRHDSESLCLCGSRTPVRPLESSCLGGESGIRGRVAGILGVEGGHALEGSLENIEAFHRRGVRLVTLTWNNANEFADSCMEDTGRGLTELGIRAVRLMNELGIIIDLSHCAPEAFFDVLEVSTAPVVCSHSACRALRDFPRNLADEQLRSLGRAKGVIGIVFLPYFLRPEEDKATLGDVLDHVEHAVEVAGIDSVALGSDFDGFGPAAPAGLEDATKMPAIAEGLLARGFSESDVRKILGENFLRLWREVAN